MNCVEPYFILFVRFHKFFFNEKNKLTIYYPQFQDKTGKSPLQLLAQTCSQIGADTGNSKLLSDRQTSSSNTKDNNNSINGTKGGNSSNNNNKGDNRSNTNSRSPALNVSDSASPTLISSVAKPVSFKPYEVTNSGAVDQHKKLSSKSPSSVVSLSPAHSAGKPSSADVNNKATTTTSGSSKSAETNPVIRSGLEVLAGQHPGSLGKDLPASLASLYAANPAFRPPAAPSAHSAHSAILPPTSLAANLASLASTSVCRDPYCRDPTCPTALYNAQISASLAGIPAAATGMSGYAELLAAHHKAMAGSAASAGSGPYICNWMNGREGYCGKRHSSAEELLQHLRTHTNLSTSDSAASLYSAQSAGSASAASAASAAALANLHRSYTLGRYHPYLAAAAAAKPPPGLSGLTGSAAAAAALGYPPPPHIPPPTPPSGLPASFYSPSLYASLYGARLAGSLP